jgi:hypothetical protein
MTATTETAPGRFRRARAALNTKHHMAALMVFGFIVVAHWAEHLVQAFQIWVLHTPRPKAGGILGDVFPWLITSEWLHYGYAIVMVVGLWLLRPGFVGRARRFWDLSFYIQIWHHFEHLLLLLQVLVGANLAGEKVPTSLLQLVFPRVELHLFYNTIVTIPMVIAIYLHLRPTRSELRKMDCSCGDKVRERAHAAEEKTTAAA